MRKMGYAALVMGMAVAVMGSTASASRLDYSDIEIVKAVQEHLNAAGFDCGSPDGKAGPGTKSAISSYREAKGLQAGEEIDTDLFNSLMLSEEQADFVNAVSEATEGQVGTNDKIEEITLYEKDLCLTVDLGEAEGNLPEEEVAYARVASLTDAILNLDGYEDLWETITVDFGDLGEVVNNKDNIQENEYGKYYDLADFRLSKQGEEKTEQEDAKAAEEENRPATMGEKNALSQAMSYLSYAPFSHEGLVDQLEFEGYTHEEAVYGADQCGADWKEQAAKQALSYLSYAAFSYSGLIEQLEFEGYSHEEAVYGADQCGADWNEQAAKQAESYLSYTSFSRSGLIEQLEFEGYTHEQAEYGANAVGY